MAVSLGCFVSADSKQTVLSPSVAGTVGIFDLKSSMKGKREGNLFSVGRDLSCPSPACPPQLFLLLSDVVHVY